MKTKRTGYNNTVKIDGKTFIYDSVVPKSDTNGADEGQRLMFHHARTGSRLFVAPRNEMTAGWVLGVNATEVE